MLFSIASEEGHNCAGIEFIYCDGQCDWSVVGTVGRVVFFVEDDGFIMFLENWGFLSICSIVGIIRIILWG